MSQSWCMHIYLHEPKDEFGEPPSVKPEFSRLPPSGTRCPHTGLSRSKLNQLVLPCKENGFKPPVESKVLRNKGTIRGTRLIVFNSLINYLHSIGRDED